jgi:hypothetical protein
MRESNGDAARSRRTADRTQEVSFPPPPKSLRVRRYFADFPAACQIFDRQVTSAHAKSLLCSGVPWCNLPDTIADTRATFERLPNEDDDAAVARMNFISGLNATPRTLIVFMTLCPFRSLSLDEKCEWMRRLVNRFVSWRCDFYCFATHVGTNGEIDRHYLLSMRAYDHIWLMQRELRKVAWDCKMFRVSCERILTSRAQLANYATRQLRGEEPASRVLVGSGVKAIGYSTDFPKAITSEYGSNSEFGQWHRKLLRLVALEHGIRSEEDYHAASGTVKRRLNYEANVLNLDRVRRGEMS